MTRASLERLTTGTGSGAACLEIIAGASKGFWLRQIDISIAAATASVFQFGRPAAKGVTPTTPVLLLPETSGDPTTIQAATALAWATPPTIPTQFYRGGQLQALVGDRLSWTFYNFYVPAATTVVVWNGSAVSTAYVNVTLDEAN